MKFTPGDWCVVTNNYGVEIHDRETKFDESGARVGDTPNLIATVAIVPGGEQMANASLLTASKDLYEALKVALEDLQEWHTSYFQGADGGIRSTAPCSDGCTTCLETIPAIKAALAKADGTSGLQSIAGGKS